VITVVVNGAAGGNRDTDVASRVSALFREVAVPVTVVSFSTGSEATAAVRSMAQRSGQIIVAAGGDGTVSTVAAGLVGTDTPLGVLPFGTLNHFAKDAGIPLEPAQAAGVVAAGRTLRVDVGQVNDRTFVNNSSLGVYPDIVVERDTLREDGYRKWTAFAVATTRVLRNYRGLTVTITAGASTEGVRTPFLFVGNNEYETDGLRLGARARLDSGRLFAYLAPRVHARELPKMLLLAVTGRAREQYQLKSFAARELQVGTPESGTVRVALDGEVALMQTPLRYLVRPRALRVIVP
jgi:diacylglycerol kinase family enzyme